MSDESSLNVQFQRIEELASVRDLDQVERSTSYGTPALKVAGKLFARMSDDATMVLHCPLEQKALLMEISPEIYFETPHYLNYPALLVRLDAISDEELALRLEDAWRFRAPAKPGGR
jgi:hypothetical protein